MSGGHVLSLASSGPRDVAVVSGVDTAAVPLHYGHHGPEACEFMHLAGPPEGLSSLGCRERHNILNSNINITYYVITYYVLILILILRICININVTVNINIRVNVNI